MQKTALIVCNGQLSKRLLFKFLKVPSIKIISCDGASDFLYRHRVRPHYIIGDLDSISFTAHINFLDRKVIFKHIPDQSQTDFEKAVKFAVARKFKKIFVIGHSGKRIDHAINNLSVLKRYCGKVNISFIDNTYEVFIAKKSLQFDYPKNKTLSFFGMPKAEGVRTKGLKYPLNNKTLELGASESISNKSSERNIQINFKKGCLLVCRKHFAKFL